MTVEQLRVQDQIDQATQRLLRTAAELGEDGIRQPSLLAGWTRSAVLAHVAQSADAMRNLLVSARTGVPRPAYLSEETRDAAILAGGQQGAAELIDGLTQAAEAFRTEVAAMPEEAWGVEVRVLEHPSFKAAEIPVRRLVEVELHHADLGAGYGPADWPQEFVTMDLAEPMRSWRDDRRARP